MVSGNRFSAVRITDVKLAIADSPARKRILILDCCYSGRAFHGEMALNSDRIKSAIDVAGTYGIAAVPADRTAFAPPRRRLTEFTQTLVTILERGVPDKASILTIEEIFDSL